LEITIDGIGGIVPGNAFHVDYIPDRYKEFCVFQAIKVDHSVSAGGWTTTIKGLPRVNVRGILGLDDEDLDSADDAAENDRRARHEAERKKMVSERGDKNLIPLWPQSKKQQQGKRPMPTPPYKYKYDTSLGRLNSGPRTNSNPRHVKRIILHHTADASAVETWSGLRNRETDSGLGLSVHYIVGRTGIIYNPVPEDRRAYHAAGHNDYTIGIEIVHTGKKSMPYTEAQYASTKKLINDIAGRWPAIEFDDIHVLAHYQKTTSGKWDPSPNFDWSKIGLPNHKTLADLGKRPGKEYYEA